MRLFLFPMLQIRFSSLDVPNFFHYFPTKYQNAEVPKVAQFPKATQYYSVLHEPQ